MLLVSSCHLVDNGEGGNVGGRIGDVRDSGVPARLGLKAPAQAWLFGAQAWGNVEPGLEPSKAVNWGPARPEAGAQGSGCGLL